MESNTVKTTLEAIGFGREFTVTFTKTDGTERKMRCMMEPPTGPIKNPNVVPVMDLDKGAWRSFKVDSVIEITHN